MEITLYLTNTLTNESFFPTGNVTGDLNSLGVQFQVIGKDCAIQYITSVLTNKNEVKRLYLVILTEFKLFEAQGLPYFGVVLLAGILECLICVFLEKSLIQNESLGRKV